jgi:ankyrin repeat protein
MALVMLAVSELSCTAPRMAASPEKIHLAAQSGDHGSIDAALEAGDDVDQTDSYGMTALTYAAASPNTAVVESLLNKGANPNHVADNGDTPLLVAARKGNLPAAKLLIERGALINKIGEDGSSALTIATAGADRKLFDLLLELGADPNSSLANSDTALIKAIRNKEVYYFDRLIAAGADPNRKGRRGNTPLIIGTFHNKPEIVGKLLSAGADANETNDSGYSALTFASGIGGTSPDIAKRLIEKGADLDQTAKDGLTPLKAACKAENGDMAAYLYEKGANPVIEDSSDEGVELNGFFYHVLGDYSLAQDDLVKARDCYRKAREYYRKTIDKYKGDVTKLWWKEVGATLASSLTEAAGDMALDAMRDYQASVQSRQFAQISAMSYAEQSRTGFQGYLAFMENYHRPYVPTYQAYQGVGTAQPQMSSSLAEERDVAKRRANELEKISLLIGEVLDCLDKNSDGGPALHTCVDTAMQDH